MIIGDSFRKKPIPDLDICILNILKSFTVPFSKIMRISHVNIDLINYYFSYYVCPYYTYMNITCLYKTQFLF